MSIWCQGPCTVIGFACVAQAQYFMSIAADRDVLRRAAAKVRSPEAETAQPPMGVVSSAFCNRSVGPMTGWGHVWTAPAVQEEFDYQRSVRVRSCIRPLSAAVWPLALM